MLNLHSILWESFSVRMEESDKIICQRELCSWLASAAAARHLRVMVVWGAKMIKT